MRKYIIPNEKYNSYIESLDQHGIKLNNDYIFLKEKIPISEFREFREYGKEIYPRILELGITALIAQSDPIALGIMEGLSSKGIDIPGDISITGVGNILHSQTSHPPLTTVHIPKIRMGRFGAETLLKLIARGANIKQRIYLKTTLINRASVRNILVSAASNCAKKSRISRPSLCQCWIRSSVVRVTPGYPCSRHALTCPRIRLTSLSSIAVPTPASLSWYCGGR